MIAPCSQPCGPPGIAAIGLVTADIRDGTCETASAPGHAADKATRGPFVLLNHVGAFRDPTEYPFDTAVLSDCLYALRTTNPALLQDLMAKLRVVRHPAARGGCCSVG
jgi:hypothetical protein